MTSNKDSVIDPRRQVFERKLRPKSSTFLVADIATGSMNVQSTQGFASQHHMRPQPFVSDLCESLCHCFAMAPKVAPRVPKGWAELVADRDSEDVRATPREGVK